MGLEKTERDKAYRIYMAKLRIYTNVLATIEKAIQKSNIQFGDEPCIDISSDAELMDDFEKIQQQLFAAAEICKARLRPTRKRVS